MHFVLMIVFTWIAIGWFGNSNTAARKRAKLYASDHPPRLYTYEYLRACELYRLYQFVPDCKDTLGDALEDARTDVFGMGYLPTNIPNMRCFHTGDEELREQPRYCSIKWPIDIMPIEASISWVKRKDQFGDGSHGALLYIYDDAPMKIYRSADDMSADRVHRAAMRKVAQKQKEYDELMVEWEKYLKESPTTIEFVPWEKRQEVYDLLQVPEERRVKQTYYEGMIPVKEPHIEKVPQQPQPDPIDREMIRSKLSQFLDDPDPKAHFPPDEYNKYMEFMEFLKKDVAPRGSESPTDTTK